MKRLMWGTVAVWGLALVFVMATPKAVACANCDSQLSAWLAINDAEYGACTSSIFGLAEEGLIGYDTMVTGLTNCATVKRLHDDEATDWWWNCTP